MTFFGWRRFLYTVGRLTEVKYKFSKSLKILVYEGTYIKTSIPKW